MKDTKLKLFLTIVALATETPTLAGSQTGGRVTTLLPGNTPVFAFTSNGTRTGTPTCASAAPNNWAVDITTPAGQALAASIITAFSMGKTLNIIGNASCLPVMANVESVSYVQVFE